MIKEDDLVLCTVKKIDRTTVFVDIEGDGQGALEMSEIAAGRIRNIREYIAPNKKIVCKVLKIINGHPQLSLRRVTSKEREEVLEKNQKEKTFLSLIKTVITNPEEKIMKIKEKYELFDFYDEAKEKPELFHKFFSKEESEKLTKIISEKKEKEKIVKKTICIKTNSESGINDIKHILSEKDADIRYLGSSNFSVSVKAKEFKDANNILTKIIENIDKKAKEKKATLEIKD
jgi:translation initiation factor 2 alpha subunit (eIF-2alpha)